MSSRLPVRDARTREAETPPLVPISALYPELHRIAARALHDHRGRISVRPTELVHELFLKFQNRPPDWQGRAQFLTLAARAMRDILTNYAAARRAQKRGGGRMYVTLDGVIDRSSACTIDLLCLDEALRTLEKECDPRESQVVELRFFAGLEVAEIAEALEVSLRTVQRDLRHARNWLFRRIEQGRSPSAR